MRAHALEQHGLSSASDIATNIAVMKWMHAGLFDGLTYMQRDSTLPNCNSRSI
jgi:hypothetical protein